MRLAEYLELHQIRRSDFATRIGKSQSYVTMICRGEIWPSREAVSRIAEVTGGAVTANDFVGCDAEGGGSAPSAA
jgi:3,4-dihydroxy 2-butanone 4-phosphate synthase/GTP cyclohydrolase II